MSSFGSFVRCYSRERAGAPLQGYKVTRWGRRHRRAAPGVIKRRTMHGHMCTCSHRRDRLHHTPGDTRASCEQTRWPAEAMARRRRQPRDRNVGGAGEGSRHQWRCECRPQSARARARLERKQTLSLPTQGFEILAPHLRSSRKMKTETEEAVGGRKKGQSKLAQHGSFDRQRTHLLSIASCQLQVVSSRCASPVKESERHCDRTPVARRRRRNFSPSCRKCQHPAK